MQRYEETQEITKVIYTMIFLINDFLILSCKKEPKNFWGYYVSHDFCLCVEFCISARSANFDLKSQYRKTCFSELIFQIKVNRLRLIQNFWERTNVRGALAEREFSGSLL